MTDLLELREISLQVPSANGPISILEDVTLRVAAGESLGLVGESGSGKSMTLRTIARLLPRDSAVGGSLTFGGSDVNALTGSELRDYRSGGVGVIFQDATAHIDPLQRIGAFMIEPLLQRGVADRRTARAQAADLLAAVGIDEPARRMDQHPLELSGGMLQRVMIASVLLCRPRLILADEPTTALDVTTQSDVLAILDELRSEQGTAMIFVTHDLDLAAAVCDRTAVMYAGTVREVRPANALLGSPLHPYTEALLKSRPHIESTVARLPVIEGRPASASDGLAGCSFAPRCPLAVPDCAKVRPVMTDVADGEVRCLRLKQLHPEAFQ